MNPWKSLAGLPRGVWILAFSTLINRMGTMAIPFMTLFLTRERGLDPATAGHALIALGLGAILAGPASGRLADRIGAARMIHASLWSFAAVIAAFPFAHGLPALLALSFLAGATGEAFRPANMALVSRLAGPERAQPAFALTRLMVNLGMSVGPAAGGFLADLDFRAVFIVDGVTSALAAVFLLFAGLPREAPNPAQDHHAHGLLPRAALRDRRFLAFWLAMLFVGLVFMQEAGAMAVDLVQLRGYAPSTFGLVFSINTVLIVLTEVPLNALVARWRRAPTMALGGLLFGVGFGALAFVDSVYAIAGTVVIWTVGEMILFPVSAAYVASLSSEEHRGEYMGMYSMAFAVAHSFGPWAGLQILAALGARPLWLIVLAVGVVGSLLLYRAAAWPAPASAPPRPEP